MYALVNDTAAPRGHLRIALHGTDGGRRGPWTERTVPLPTLETPFQVSPETAADSKVMLENLSKLLNLIPDFFIAGNRLECTSSVFTLYCYIGFFSSISYFILPILGTQSYQIFHHTCRKLDNDHFTLIQSAYHLENFHRLPAYMGMVDREYADFYFKPI